MPKVGLALGGGGARGFAHVGVLKVLEAEGIPIDVIAGTSMGGLIGSLYASGMSARELETESRRMTRTRQLVSLADASLARRGLFKGERIVEYLRERLGARTFSDLRIPAAVVAVDLNDRCQVILDRGSVAEAVRATIAVPGVFVPVLSGSQVLVDGGVLNNVPADVVRAKGAERVIAVGCHGAGETDAFPRFGDHPLLPNAFADTVDILYRSLDTMVSEIARLKLAAAAPDVMILPRIPSDLTSFGGFRRAREAIVAGEEAAREALPAIRRMLETPLSE